MPYISRWLLLVSVILQISNLEAILYSGHFFFIHPVENLNKPFWKMALVSIRFWLTKFIQELNDKNGDVKPEKTMYEIVCVR